MQTETQFLLNHRSYGKLLGILCFALICIAFMFYLVNNPGGSLHLFFLLLVLFPAVSLAAMDSKHLLPYICCVWAFISLLRRLADWMQGSYQNIPILSLAPLLVTLTLIIALTRRPLRLPVPLQKALLCFAVALAYGGIIGLIHNSVASLYEFGNYAAPILIVLYMVFRPADERERDGLIATLVNIALVIAVYGWFQFLVAPPWDTLWVKNAQMVSNGLPEAGKIRVFSTLNSAGSTAAYLACALVPMILEKRWRGRFGWFGVVLVVSALAITLVRAMYFLVPLFLFAYVITSPGARRRQTTFAILATGLILYFGVPYLPGAGIIIGRFETLGNLDQDRSLSARSAFLPNLLPKMIEEPLGKGIGSTGASTKLTNAGKMGEDSVIDNGFLTIFYTFGMAGGIVFFVGLWLLYVAVRRSAQKSPPLRDYARLAQGALIFFLGMLVFGNPFPTLSGLLFWFFIALPMGETITRRQRQTRADPKEIPA